MIEGTFPAYVYILRCADDTLYTGMTTDISRRLHEHNSLKTGAKYTRGRRPVTLVYAEGCASQQDAKKRECVLKKLKRTQKVFLINTMTSLPPIV